MLAAFCISDLHPHVLSVFVFSSWMNLLKFNCQFPITKPNSKEPKNPGDSHRQIKKTKCWAFLSHSVEAAGIMDSRSQSQIHKGNFEIYWQMDSVAEEPKQKVLDNFVGRHNSNARWNNIGGKFVQYAGEGGRGIWWWKSQLGRKHCGGSMQIWKATHESLK